MCAEAITRKMNIAMNYENYIKSLVEGKNIGLIGWPEEVDFKRMSKQSAIGPLRTLRDALKCGMCRWKVLTAGEKKRLVEKFDDMVKKGRGEVEEEEGCEGREGARAAPCTVEDEEGWGEGNEGQAWQR